MAPSGRGTRRKPGRPPLKVYPRGRQARHLRLATPKQAAEDSPGPTVSEADKGQASQSAAPDGSQLTHEELRFMALNRLPTGVPPLTVHSNNHFSKPLLLDTMLRKPPEWQLVEQVSTELMPNWFDAQKNDYSSYRFTQSRAAKLVWFGHPGDSPLDLRARCCIVRWDDDSDLTIVPGRVEAAKHAKGLVRWEYLCRGACSFMDDTDENSTVHLEEEDEENHETEGQPNRWKRCVSGVKLVIEVTADNLTRVNIWQKHTHPDAAPHQLLWSRRLRNLVGERYRLVGAKASTIMREVVNQYRNPVHTSRPTNAPLEGPYEFPAFRRPRKHQIENMVPAITRRARLDQDPFVAVHMMQERNPEKFYNYSAHDYSRPDSESTFTVAMADAFTLENMILHGSRDGMGADSSWRNKNENRAAVTFLITVDSNEHLVPGSVLLSANVRTVTLATYLEATKERVRQRAKEILDNPGSIIHVGNQAELQALCQKISVCGWIPRKWMIDKCYAELNAIRKVFPGAVVRLCQFHVVQAILRWDCDDGGITKAPRISSEVKYEILQSFRVMQRCRTWEDWPAARAQFLQETHAIIYSQGDIFPAEEPALDSHSSNLEDDAMGHDIRHLGPPVPKNQPKTHEGRRGYRSIAEMRTQWEFVDHYFRTNWFTDQWIPAFTDIGLPAGQTRDGTWNVNNWTERAFLAFDTIFLDNRRNKRIDRLIAIIINEFFPFYQHWSTTPKLQPQELTEMNLIAHNIWDMGELIHLGGARYRVLEHLPDSRLKAPEGYICDIAIPSCRCYRFQQTGKLCVHLTAARLEHSNGPVQQWKDLECSNQRSDASMQARLEQRPSHTLKKDKPGKGGKQRSDKYRDQELRHMVKRLESRRPASSPMHQPHPDGRGAGIKELAGGFITGKKNQYNGRPAGIRAMGSWRAHTRVTQQRHVPQFSQKRGRKPSRRLAKNSLFPAITNFQKKSLKVMTKLRATTYMDGHGQEKLVIPQKPGWALDMALPDQVNAEDQSIWSPDVSRWAAPSYMLRIEEVEVFVDILNTLSTHCEWDTWSCLAPGISSHVASCLNDRQRLMHSRHASSLVDKHKSRPCKRMVFIHLSAGHWQIFCHDLTLSAARPCVAYNSLAGSQTMPASISIAEQWQIHAYLTNRKASTDHTFTSEFLGVQDDATSCGFWAVWFGFACAMGISVPQSVAGRTLSDVKKMLGLLYVNHVNGAHGLQEKVLKDAFASFIPPVSHCQDGIVPKDGIVAVCMGSEDVTSTPHEPSWVTPLTHIDECFFNTIHDTDGLNFLIAGKYTITSRTVRDTSDPAGLTSENLLNGYLHLLSADLTQAESTSISFHIFDTLLADHLRNHQLSKDFPNKVSGPRGKKRNKHDTVKPLWVPEVNIFDYELLILPWFLPSIKHWISVGINTTAHTIRVYDSLCIGLPIIQSVSKHVFHFLSWEHGAHFTTALPSVWQSNLDSYLNDPALHVVPQQPNATDCGIYTIAFIRLLCEGMDPLQLPFGLGTQQIQHIRAHIVVRLAQEWILQQAIAKGMIDEEIITAPAAAPKTKRQPPRAGSHPYVPMPFPLDVHPLPIFTPTAPGPMPSHSSNRTPDPLQYCPSVDSWGLWRMPNDGLYYPAQVIAINTLTRMATLKWLETGARDDTEECRVTLLDPQPFDTTFDACYEAIDDLFKPDIPAHLLAPIDWPWVLDTRNLELEQNYADQTDSPVTHNLTPSKVQLHAQLWSLLPVVVDILGNHSKHFAWLMSEWSEWKNRTQRSANPFTQSFIFFDSHGGHLLDRVDRHLLEALCTTELSTRLHGMFGEATANSLLASNCAFSVGSSILAYYVLGISLGVSGEQACEYDRQGLLFRPASHHESAWIAIRERILLNTKQSSQLEYTHRIPCKNLDIPEVQLLPGPLLRVTCENWLLFERTTALSNDSEAPGAVNIGDSILTVSHTVNPNHSISSISTIDTASKGPATAMIDSVPDATLATSRTHLFGISTIDIASKKRVTATIEASPDATLTTSCTHRGRSGPSTANATLATKFSGPGQHPTSDTIPKLRIFKKDGVYHVELASSSKESDMSKSREHKQGNRPENEGTSVGWRSRLRRRK